MQTRFPSILHPDKYGYILGADWNWERRGNHALCFNLEKFETMGDGMTQHSGSWCAQFADFTDAALSIAAAVVADPGGDWEMLGRLNVESPFRAVDVDFAFSVIYKDDGKTRYYSVQEGKVTTSEAKKHDKRYERVEPRHDGSPLSALTILKGERNPDVFHYAAMVQQVHDAACPRGKSFMFEDVSPNFAELRGDWRQAFYALQSAVRAVDALGYARRGVECAKGNTLRASAEASMVAA